MSLPQTQSAWLMLAISSGACAAFNGVFAKLTTTQLTASWASSIALTFGLSAPNKLVEYGIRSLFFGMNLLFNAIMWGLFTRALTLASSTVRVSIINTSANFIVTAVLSFFIFRESLPGLWWLGAAMLVAGSVIIGMRDETEKKSVATTTGEAPLHHHDADADADGYRDEDEGEDTVELDSVKDNSSDDDGVLK
ncbi:transcription initiation factor iia small subunit [Pyrenophora seminiperda CCB06]|uniref:Transcription initiation factor iia small subunit n=1 Tax=Pyrenophora seminiperda CCB06 TaxID=1302712 RepID=A0A3M7MEB5_9PLEO|nr:transcription initiation factor iia small subunit [Pyrenophora seminiperda CCB06]